jgi:transcriptional regulator with XRE-family HTH domain
MDTNFAQQLKQARMQQALSQAALGQKLGVSPGAVSQWETGANIPTESNMALLRQVLGDFDQSPQNESDLATEKAPTEGDVFGAWLRQARANAQLTVPELANRADVSAVAIYNIEAGRSRNPQKATREKLEKALQAKVPVDVTSAAAEAQSIEGLGALMDFDPMDVKNLPECPGVYVFYDVSDRPVYVGKAEKISTRVRQHQDKFWFKYPIVSHGAFVQIDNEILRHQVEQVLIRFLKSNAVINKQSVDRD